MYRQRAIIFLLAVALFALTPLAEASPPDPTWIGGFYDDADYDDVVLMITASMGLADVAPGASLPSLLPVVAPAPQLDETDPSRPYLPSAPTRAPPSA
jgi:hypothetical protein